MKIDSALLDTLTAQAKANPRLRQAYDLRTTPEDNSQRILNRWSSESRRQNPALFATIKEMAEVKFKNAHSEDCRKRAEECFDKDWCFEKYVELYENALR